MGIAHPLAQSDQGNEGLLTQTAAGRPGRRPKCLAHAWWVLLGRDQCTELVGAVLVGVSSVRAWGCHFQVVLGRRWICALAHINTKSCNARTDALRTAFATAQSRLNLVRPLAVRSLHLAHHAMLSNQTLAESCFRVFNVPRRCSDFNAFFFVRRSEAHRDTSSFSTLMRHLGHFEIWCATPSRANQLPCSQRAHTLSSDCATLPRSFSSRPLKWDHTCWSVFFLLYVTNLGQVFFPVCVAPPVTSLETTSIINRMSDRHHWAQLLCVKWELVSALSCVG